MITGSGFNQDISLSIIKQAQAGDMNAIECIYRTYCEPCHFLAFRICRDKALSEDIVHDAFMNIIQQISGLKDKAVIGGWIKRIVTNVAINKLRKYSRIESLPSKDEEMLISNNLFEHQWLDICDDLEKLMTNLSVTTRAVLILHEIEGYTHQEIAEIFDKTESFSKAALSRAYTKLKQLALAQGVNYASK